MQRPQNDFRKVDLEYKNELSEFKSRATDKIYKEAIAFDNTDGGVYEESTSKETSSG